MAEETEVEKWNPHKMADQVRDKIQLQVTELFPPEMWKKLVEDEVTKFTTDTREETYHNSGRYNTVPAAIKPLIAKALKEAAEKFLKEELPKISQPNLSVWIQDFITNNWEQLLKSQLHNAIMGHMMSATLNVHMGDPRTDPSSQHYDPNYRPGY